MENKIKPNTNLTYEKLTVKFIHKTKPNSPNLDEQSMVQLKTCRKILERYIAKLCCQIYMCLIILLSPHIHCIVQGDKVLATCYICTTAVLLNYAP